MSKTSLPKWDEERTATLESLVGDETPVSAETVAQAAEALKTTARSVAAKLRKMDYEVESTAKSTGKSYTAEEEAEIIDFLQSHPNQFTYAEIASQILGGSRSAKQIQGKILSMELYGLVKATEKVERPKSYTDEEEAKLEKLVLAGGFIEDIADEMDRPINSIRGKILSMSRTNPEIKIPKQREYATKKEDAFTALGDVSEMTVEEIADAIDKTPRGVRTLLTHRGIDCADHKGAKKKAAIEEKKAAAAA
jgi:predicted transcriptional regulator